MAVQVVFFPSLSLLHLCARGLPDARKSIAGSGLGGVSTAGGLWLPRSDYIGATGGASRLVALSVFCVADWADTQWAEMAQPGTLGLPPRDLTGKTATAMDSHRKMHQFHTWFTGSTPAVEFCYYLGWKCWTLAGWELWNEGYAFDANDSIYLHFYNMRLDFLHLWSNRCFQWSQLLSWDREMTYLFI